MDIFHMSDVISLIGLPYPPSGHSTYNIPCPCCDDKPGKKHLNINLKKMYFDVPGVDFPAAFLIYMLIMPGYPEKKSEKL